MHLESTAEKIVTQPFGRKKSRAFQGTSRVGNRYVYRKETGSKFLQERLKAGQAIHVGRFGTTELAVVDYFLHHGEPDIQIPAQLLNNLATLSGFYPPVSDLSLRFAAEFIETAKNLDVVGIRWEAFEHRFADGDAIASERLAGGASLVGIESLSYPFLYGPMGWTQALAGRDVLVIHPFDESIQRGYQQRRNIFPPGAELPDFQLRTYRPVQTVGLGWQKPPHKDWFTSLDVMKEDIGSLDFDVAIIGAGAFGHFLAAFCKELGKSAIHLGGATQVVFGVTGKRWTQQNSLDYLGDKISCEWIYPEAHERPTGADLVEDGCYWGESSQHDS